MAWHHVSDSIPGLEASADLSATPLRLVVINGDGQIALAGAGDRAIGVLLNEPAEQGRVAQVQSAGVARVSASAAIAIGDDVASAADGQVRTATAGDAIIGQALQAAGGADEVISVLLVYKGAAA